MNREHWLTLAVSEFIPLFRGQGLEVPDLHVSCGFPSRNATSNKKRAIGECWDGLCGADKKPQLFISPLLIDPVAPQGVLATLAHEIVHASIGTEAKHGPRFKAAMKKIGLEGKPTATTAGDTLLAKCQMILDKVGPYPHSELKIIRERKVQTTRMLKACCPLCEYTIRLSQKWADVGLPECPADDTPLALEVKFNEHPDRE